MYKLSFKQNKPFYSHFLICTLLFLFLLPLPAFAGDSNSVAMLRHMGKAFVEIVRKASPAVVWVTTEQVVTKDYPSMRNRPFGGQKSPFDDDFFEFFFDQPRSRKRSPQPKSLRKAQGSGFIISADGYILTNNHVVENVDKVMVKLADEREFEAKVIGADPESDVAVIKIDANNLSILELADSDALEVGEWVLAIGNPLGLSHTVTAGIVSAKGRNRLGLADFENFIQTDAAINRGNSGGPLLNLDGKVVGISTAIYGPGVNIGIGFAIPINMAKSVYPQLVETGTVVRGFL